MRGDGEDRVLRHARLSPRGEARRRLNRARALAGLNARLLREFSRRTTARLRAALPLRLALPALEPFLAENVEKEVRKDERLVHRAAAALADGARAGPEDARLLLDLAREIDRQFLARVGRFPVRIEIAYERIEPLRLQRIERGLDLAQRILEAWQQGEKARAALGGEELTRRLLEIFRLYAQETEALSHSVRLPAPLVPIRDRLGERLMQVMTEAAQGVIASHKARRCGRIH